MTYQDNVSDAEDGESTCKQILHKGTDVQNFVFNRLDNLLWKKLKSGYKFENDKAALDINYIKERYVNFKFSFRTSVEHYFPQTEPWGEEDMEDVDCFGNLCLITPSSNSKLSNWSPAERRSIMLVRGV